MRGQLVHQLGQHLLADPRAASIRMNREVQDVQPVPVQLVDHESDHLLVGLRYHSDAVSLSQAAEEIVLRPGVFETGELGGENFGHVPPDHPADVNADFFSLCASSAHERAPCLSR